MAPTFRVSGPGEDLEEETKVAGVATDRSGGEHRLLDVLGCRMLDLVADELGRAFVSVDAVEEGGHANRTANVGADAEDGARSRDDASLATTAATDDSESANKQRSKEELKHLRLGLVTTHLDKLYGFLVVPYM